MKQLRRAPRRDFIGRIKVTWKTGNQSISSYGMIQDKSTGGFGITFPQNIPVGTIAALAQGSITQFGIIRHCNKWQGKFFLGVELCELEESAKPMKPMGAGKPQAELPVEEKQKPQVDRIEVRRDSTPEDAEEERRRQLISKGKINEWFAMNGNQGPDS